MNVMAKIVQAEYNGKKILSFLSLLRRRLSCPSAARERSASRTQWQENLIFLVIVEAPPILPEGKYSFFLNNLMFFRHLFVKCFFIINFAVSKCCKTYTWNT